MPAGAAQADIADTSANYKISSKEYENITIANAKVYGFIGDTDISVIDATSIQLYIAKLAENSNVAHTLYEITSNTSFNTDTTKSKCLCFLLTTHQKSAKMYLSTIARLKLFLNGGIIMKKLLSVILILTMLVSISAFSTGAKSVDLADINAIVDNTINDILADIELDWNSKNEIVPTGTRTFDISEKAQIPYTDVDGYPYGYIGDVNADADVTIFDATEIQCYIAELTSFVATQKLLADVDLNGNITIMDVTEIQFYIAELSSSDSIFHILYSPYDNFDPLVDTFDDIANYLKAIGAYDEVYDAYYTSQLVEEQGIQLQCFLEYYAEYDVIIVTTSVYNTEMDMYIDISMQINRGDMEFSYYSSCYDLNATYYYIEGYGNVTGVTSNQELIFDLYYTDFEYDESFDPDEILNTLPQMCFVDLASGNLLIQNDVVGSILDLVMPVSMIL